MLGMRGTSHILRKFVIMFYQCAVVSLSFQILLKHLLKICGLFSIDCVHS